MRTCELTCSRLIGEQGGTFLTLNRIISVHVHQMWTTTNVIFVLLCKTCHYHVFSCTHITKLKARGPKSKKTWKRSCHISKNVYFNQSAQRTLGIYKGGVRICPIGRERG